MPITTPFYCLYSRHNNERKEKKEKSLDGRNLLQRSRLFLERWKRFEHWKRLEKFRLNAGSRRLSPMTTADSSV
jgi:hypothetical protein